MATITKVRLWNDPGYTEGSLKVPPASDTLPTPYRTYTTGFHVEKQRLFSNIRINDSFTQLLNVSYIEVTMDMNNGSDRVFYGWVTGVNMMSDTTDSPLVSLDWHIDLWRTYLADAEFGAGMVTRRPQSALPQPPQSYPYRYLEASTVLQMTTKDNNIWWVYFTAIETEDGVSRLRTYCFPVSKDNKYLTYKLLDQNGIATFAPSLDFVTSGSWDEYLALDPSAITSSFICPVSPGDYTLGQTTIQMSGDVSALNIPDNFGCFIFDSVSTERTCYGFDYGTTDDQLVVIQGFDGATAGVVPWGFDVSRMYYRAIVDPTSAYIQLRGLSGSFGVLTTSNQEGMCFNIPMIPVPVSENNWSSYVYSGARQADIDQRRQQSTNTLIGGLTGSTLSGAMTGAMTGAMVGSAVPVIGTVAGALIGGVSGAAMSGVGYGVDYGVETGYTNDAMQDIEDYRAAHQTNGLIMSGTGFDAIRFGNPCIVAVVLTRDTHSQQVHANDVAMYGIKTSEPTSSCQALIDAGGPLRIVNLEVEGDIPAVAKQYFKKRFNDGVRII